MDNKYRVFLRQRQQGEIFQGFDPVWMPDFLFDFQKSLVEWAIRKGKCAIFADCGLGKTPMQLVWAENVVRKSGGKVLIITPLAVSHQTIREGDKFGIEVKRSIDGQSQGPITVTNYEKLHMFDPEDYTGVVCDESSAIKQFGGKRRKEVIRFMQKTPYRLLCTATAAPNDYMELGTHSEALGVMGQMDMLNMFFKSTDDMNHAFFKQGDFWNTHKWTFKAHSEQVFWKWVVGWARAIRKPSDIGFPDEGFVLPPFDLEQHMVDCQRTPPGELFPRIAITLREQREERKFSLKERCEKVASLVDHKSPAVVWCQSNDEGDMLADIIPHAMQVAGSHTDEYKEETFLAFASGQLRVLVTKPRIGAFGLNWQHCNHMTFFPSHSFEQFYQGVRRCWRFGQTKPVTVDIVTTKGEAGVTANLNRKAAQCEEMFKQLVAHMNDAIRINNEELFQTKPEVPTWL
jgi:hypothetical protein